MHKIVEDAIDQLMQGDCYDEPCCVTSDCKELKPDEEEVQEDKEIKGLKVGFSIFELDFDLPDFSAMESRFEDEEFVESVRMLIRKKAIEKLEEAGDNVSIRIHWTDPSICQLY